MTNTYIRVTAFAAAMVIVGTLFSTIVTHMPPAGIGSSVLARETPEVRTEVAIVPARIDVIGLRSSDTAMNAIAPARPGS